tara:strand:- start:152 stop:625 length:474 start_codon:yes stop_codon:yes gene_type:complete
MNKRLTLLLFIGLAWGQALHFTNNDKTIKIDTSEKLQINDTKYNLIDTDYTKKYILLLKGKSQKQDTLRFDSVISFKYYEKSLKSFSSNTIKCTKYGVLIGAIAGLPEGINYGFHWVVGGGILYGGLGALCGAIYSMLRPIASEKITLEKEGWYISN